MTQIFTKAYWIRSRRNNMIAARGCRDALTNPEGFWRYAPDDERVAWAVGVWVEKARQAHGIVVGKRPVCYAVTNSGEGNLYAD